MSLKDPQELENTKKKLAQLEAHYEVSRKRVVANKDLHAMSLRSIRRLINQLKEEIALFECRSAR